MFTVRFSLARVVVIGLALITWPKDPLQAAPPGKEQVAHWIKQLGSNDFEEREEASRKLWEAGPAAEDAVAAGCKDKDAEIQHRCVELHDKFKWSIYPDTPKAVVDLVAQYKAIPDDKGGSRKGEFQRAALRRQLLDQGAPGFRVVLKTIIGERNAQMRKELIYDVLSSELPQAMPGLLREKQHALVDQFLDIALENAEQIDHHHTINNYVAYWLLRERLDERIAHHRMLEGEGNKRQAEILTYLLRAKGDALAALAAARRSGNNKFIDRMLLEMADWKELAARGKNTLERREYSGEESPAQQLAKMATFHHFAGNEVEAKGYYEEMRKFVGDGTTIGQGFLLNGRPNDAFASARRGGDYAFAYYILISHFRFAEADALVEKACAESTKSELIARLELMQAHTWYRLGHKEKALAVFARYADKIKNGEEWWFESLIDEEARAGLTDQAIVHVAGMIDVIQGRDHRVVALVRLLFPQRQQQAVVLYATLLRSKDEKDHLKVLRQVRDVLEGKLPQKDVAALLDDVSRYLNARKEDQERVKLNPRLVPRFPDKDFLLHQALSYPQSGWLALAELAAVAGLDGRAETFLEKADTVESLIELGDRQARRNQWEAAARWYKKSWNKFGHRQNHSPLPIYLYGLALVKAGREKEGSEALETAHWATLGAYNLRTYFSTELLQRGHLRDSQRENELSLHLTPIGDGYNSYVLRQMAMAHKDYLAATVATQRRQIDVLLFQRNDQPWAFLGATWSIHRYRALVNIKSGKVTEALQEADQAWICLPGNSDSTIDLVVELDHLSHKEDAARLYQRSRTLYEKICRDHPRAALGHDGIARLSAGCRRDLDDALVHARKAVELNPDKAGYLNTLAEVYFQLGQKEQALETFQKAIKLDPTSAYLSKQLKRLEAGDPRSPRPDLLAGEYDNGYYFLSDMWNMAR